MERRQRTKEGATLQELQEMAHVEVWGRKRTSFFWVTWHCRFICSFTSKETATVWISPGKAILMPCCSILHLLNYVNVSIFPWCCLSLLLLDS